MLFKYTARDESGKTVNNTIEAKDQKEVMEKLRQMRLIVTKVTEGRSGATASAKKGPIMFGGGVKKDEVIIFSRQLATMIDAGLTIINSLEILSRQIKNPVFKEIVLKIKEDVETSGQPLSTALTKYPKVFSALFTNMVRAGEISGTLEDALNQLAAYMEASGNITKKIKSAAMYPILIGSMAAGIGLALLLFVVPMFAGIYKDFGGDLPGPTKVLIFLSNILKKYFVFMIIFAIGGGIAVLRAIKTPRGKLIFDKITLRLPIVGELVRKIAISKVTRTLGTLVKSGVPILEALVIVGRTSGNRVIEIAVDSAQKRVREGETITKPLAETGVFPPMVIEMISVGEETGELEKMLTKVADFYDQEVDTAVSGLTATLEPVMMGFLGVGVGGMVIALYLPIFKLATVVGGGD